MCLNNSDISLIEHLIRVEKTPQEIETELDDLFRKYSFKVRGKRNGTIEKAAVGMQDNPWNLKPLIIGLIKEESKTNKMDAIKYGRTAKDKVSRMKRKKKKKSVVGKPKRLWKSKINVMGLTSRHT